MNCTKATHRGTCQVCGCIQLLPGGRLSKHGYTVKWGFFSGVCSGAHGLPFEQSTDLIEAAIARVEKQVADTEAEIARYADLNDPVNDGTDVWIQVYADRYLWVKAALTLETVSYTDGTGSFVVCHYTTNHPVVGHSFRDVNKGRVEHYGLSRDFPSIREWARFANLKYAAHLEELNRSRRNYLAWQRDRVAKWAPAPLIAR